VRYSHTKVPEVSIRIPWATTPGSLSRRLCMPRTWPTPFPASRKRPSSSAKLRRP